MRDIFGKRVQNTEEISVQELIDNSDFANLQEIMDEFKKLYE